MKNQSLTGDWQFRQSNSHEWLPARVPGGVHTDLMAAGRIPDPFAFDNEKRVQWVVESNWEYQRTFTIDPALLAEEKIFLVADGLDTLAEVNLNGYTLGQTDNMFRQYRWEVKSLLREGENQLTVFFPSLLKFLSKKQNERKMLGVQQALPGGPYLRKAPCQFGWDWGPMLPPIGIWQDIRLEGYSIARLETVHLRQEHPSLSKIWVYDLEPGQVKIEAGVTIEEWQEADLQLHLRVTSPDGQCFEALAFLLDRAASEEEEESWEAEDLESRGNGGAGSDDAEEEELEDEFEDDWEEEDDLFPEDEEDWLEDEDEEEEWLSDEEEKARGDFTLEVRLDNPRLWWPNGYGEQPLYDVELSLTAEDRELDKRTFRIGLRKLELEQEPDQWGKSFTFVVNDVPIFAKGSNWIPADSFPTRLSEAHLEHLIQSAAASHQNMLRVWGGGFYEEDRFYDLCDRYGILIWQDCIYSCSVYPLDDPRFLENLHEETLQNVRRLRHHPSLALWCGNNEMEWGWESWGWNQPDLASLKEAYQQHFYHHLPEWIKAEDPDHPYWPSSPSSNTPFTDANGQTQGDTHYWDVWHGRKPFTAYRTQFPRFMSEFGFQSLPPLETICTYAAEKDWNMTSFMMEHHQRNAAGNGLMIAQMTETFCMPKDFPSLVYLTMVLQAEGIRYGVEHWRRNKNRVSGTLYWQLNDCWPVASWSSLDYFGRWKALHYAAKRFYAPVLLSIEDKFSLTYFGDWKEAACFDLHLTSDLTTPFEGTLKWELITLAGETLKRGRLDAALEPLQSAKVLSLTFDLPEAQRREVVFFCELWEGENFKIGRASCRERV